MLDNQLTLVIESIVKFTLTPCVNPGFTLSPLASQVLNLPLFALFHNFLALM